MLSVFVKPVAKFFLICLSADGLRAILLTKSAFVLELVAAVTDNEGLLAKAV